MIGMSVPRLSPWSWEVDVLSPDVCQPPMAETVVCGAWVLWTGRNASRHDRKTWKPGGAAIFISFLLEDMASLKHKDKEVRVKHREKWSKPTAGWYKVNSDAEFDPASCTGSVGVVIRDADGCLVGTAARWFDDVSDVITAKALAAKEGLELAQELGLEQVILEVDSEESIIGEIINRWVMFRHHGAW